MTRLDRRLGQVEVVARRRRQAAAPRYDVSALTYQEQYELDTLLARAGAATSRKPWAQVSLSAAEEERLVVLAARVRVREPGSR